MEVKNKIKDKTITDNENLSLLQLVDEYIKVNGIPFKDIWIKRTLFPSEFNRILDSELNKLNSKSKIDKDYCFSYDNNGNLILRVQAENTNVVLCTDPSNVKLSYPATKMNFQRIFDKACLSKYNNAKYEVLKNIILKYHPMIDEKTLSLELAEEMDVINTSIEAEYNKNKSFVMDNKESLMMFIPTLNIIKEYIDYLNNEYKSKLEGETIIYEKDKSDEKQERTPLVETHTKNPKKFSQIPVSERVATLESNGYLFKCKAKERGNGSIDQLCYVYELSNGKYELILEPYSGEGRTRIVGIDLGEKLTFDKFKGLAHYYLHLSNKNTLDSKNIALIYHTTYKTYKNSIDYAISRDESISVNEYTKNKIDSIIEMEKSKQLSK